MPQVPLEVFGNCQPPGNYKAQLLLRRAPRFLLGGTRRPLPCSFSRRPTRSRVFCCIITPRSLLGKKEAHRRSELPGAFLLDVCAHARFVSGVVPLNQVGKRRLQGNLLEIKILSPKVSCGRNDLKGCRMMFVRAKLHRTGITARSL